MPKENRPRKRFASGACSSISSEPEIQRHRSALPTQRKRPGRMTGSLVRMKGLRTPTVSLPLEPESSASANSATSAYTVAAASKPEPLALACFVEQVMGVEPTSSAWKADVLAVVRHLRISSCARAAKCIIARCFTKRKPFFKIFFKKLFSFSRGPAEVHRNICYNKYYCAFCKLHIPRPGRSCALPGRANFL